MQFNFPPLVDIALAGGITIPAYMTIEWLMKTLGYGPDSSSGLVAKVILAFLSGAVGFALTPMVKSLLGLDGPYAPPLPGPNPSTL